MKMYRPVGWAKLNVVNHPLHCLAPDACTNFAYEAGADAMLEELIKKGLREETANHFVSYYGNKIPGTLVFIPDGTVGTDES